MDDERSSLAEFNPDPERMGEVQITVSVRQRRTGRQDWKSYDIREVSFACNEPIGVDLNKVGRQLYCGLGDR